MIKSHPAVVVVTLGALVTTGAAIAASQIVNSASSGNTGTASSGQAKQTPKPTKSAEATPPPKSLTLTGSLDVTGLAPGVSITRTLNIGNVNNQDVELQSVSTVLSGPSPAPTTGTCSSPADFEVIVAGYNSSTGVGTPVTIRKNSSLGVPVTVRLNNSATRNQDPCKGRSWTFTFTATATSK